MKIERLFIIGLKVANNRIGEHSIVAAGSDLTCHRLVLWVYQATNHQAVQIAT